MGHWLDVVAKASARSRGSHRTSSPPRASLTPGPGRPDASASAARQQGLSRRELIRKGALVGATAWTVPVLQSALAPVAAASCTTACPAGTACTTNATCASGVCQGGVCFVPYGVTGACVSDTGCQSGNCLNGWCAPSWPGTTCTANSQCLSGKCVGGRCFENGLDSSCRTTADCTDNTTCSGTTKTCGGVDALCQNNNKCVSGRCRGGVCA